MNISSFHSIPSHTERALPLLKAERFKGSSEALPAEVSDSFTASSVALKDEAPAALGRARSMVESAEAGHAQTPKVDIKNVQDQLTKNLPDVDVRFGSIDTFGDLNGRLASMQELEQMMGALYEQSKIPYEYIKDGCYARAHLMDEMFRQHDINNAKMFVKGDLEAKNDIMDARWWYHVAPLVFVDDGSGNPVPKVIDPGFVRHPMDPEEWVKAMNKGPKVEVDLVKAEQYYPREGSPDRNFAASLGPSVSTAQNYSHRLWGIKKAKGLPVSPSWEKPTWNTPGSGGSYSVNGKVETVFPEGVDTSRRESYATFGAGSSLLAMEHAPNREPVSAMWENRPSGGFDPYAA